MIRVLKNKIIANITYQRWNYLLHRNINSNNYLLENLVILNYPLLKTYRSHHWVECLNLIVTMVYFSWGLFILEDCLMESTKSHCIIMVQSRKNRELLIKLIIWVLATGLRLKYIQPVLLFKLKNPDSLVIEASQAKLMTELLIFIKPLSRRLKSGSLSCHLLMLLL